MIKVLTLKMKILTTLTLVFLVSDLVLNSKKCVMIVHTLNHLLQITLTFSFLV